MKKDFHWLKDRERLLLEQARRSVYKTLDDDGELALHWFLPKELREGGPRAALLFFHGGDRKSVV